MAKKKAGKSAKKSSGLDADLVGQIKGLYRILELHSLDTSGDREYVQFVQHVSDSLPSVAVDTIKIAEGGLRAFLDSFLPGSYQDITRIDLTALDSVSAKVIGIYGSRSEIVRFLQTTAGVDPSM